GCRQAGYFAGHCRHLERGHGVECHSVSGANYGPLVRAVGEGQTWADRADILVLIPVMAVKKRHRTLRAGDRLVRNVHAAGGFWRREVGFPAYARVQCEIRADPPFVLHIAVVLLEPMSDVPQRDGLATAERQERVAL